MSSQGRSPRTGRSRGWWFGVLVGVVLTVITVLASGFMIETTNTDTFCVTCHVMTPFRDSWQQAVHGGQNRQGFAAQCVDCHLPHGNFFEFFMVKGMTGTGDVIQNFYIDGAEFDWAGNAEKRRLDFTFDSACRHCHHVLTPPGMPSGGFIAHRAYLRGDTGKRCVACHPRVGHKDMVEMAERFFEKT
ncbi:MAG: NapC/NirT family cytochrome c [Deltaproteobacteria bacterium]|nr:NapC/NirT family cytochrome c [Deltaproteobacteria bacterium]